MSSAQHTSLSAAFNSLSSKTFALRETHGVTAALKLVWCSRGGVAKQRMQAPTLSASASSASSTALALCMPAACSIAATSASMSVSGRCCAVSAAVVVALAAPPRGFENASVSASRLACGDHNKAVYCYKPRLLGQLCPVLPGGVKSSMQQACRH